MDAAAIAVLAVCMLQLAGAWAALRGHLALARQAAWLCPAALLTLALLRMGWPGAHAPLLAVEQALLLTLLGALLLALTRARQAGHQAIQGGGLTLADGGLWLLNSAMCAAFVYLQFFFRLF